MCDICGQPNFMRCNCASAQPFCDQCSPNTNCTSITDSQCVIYHFASPGYTPPPTRLINMGMPNGSSAEAIFERIDTLFGAGFFRPWNPGNTNTLKLHLDGPGLPVILRGDVQISTSTGNTIVANPDGLFAPSFNPDYKVKVDSTAPPRYLKDSMIGGTDGCVSITVNDIGGLINIQPLLDIQCFTDRICSSSGTTKAELGACLLSSSLSVLDTSSIHLTLTPILNGVQLSANSKISADSGNVISIHSDGLYASGGTTVTANNGLNISSPGNVQLGGTLLQNTTIDAQTFSLVTTSTRTLQLAVDNGIVVLSNSLSITGGGILTNSNNNIEALAGQLFLTPTSDLTLGSNSRDNFCGTYAVVAFNSSNNITSTNGIPSGLYAGAAATNSGNVTDLAGIKIGGVNSGLGGTYTGTITNYYGLRISDIAASVFGSTITNKYAIYQVGTTDISRFFGPVQNAGGSTQFTSDERVKENIDSFNRGLSEIEKINTKTFNYTYNKNRKVTGIIAQELEQIIPEAVEKGNFDTPAGEKFDDFRMIDQNVLFYTMLNAIKELSAQNKVLSSQILDLQSKFISFK